MDNFCLEPQTTIKKWMEMVISNHFLCKDWVHHPIETTIWFHGQFAHFSESLVLESLASPESLPGDSDGFKPKPWDGKFVYLPIHEWLILR